MGLSLSVCRYTKLYSFTKLVETSAQYHLVRSFSVELLLRRSLQKQ